MNKIERAIQELLAWCAQDTHIALPATALGLLDIVSTGLADLGTALPTPMAKPDGLYMREFFIATERASKLVEDKRFSARTLAMLGLARDHASYHVAAITNSVGEIQNLDSAWNGSGRSAICTSFCELTSHLALGFAIQGRVPHCGPPGRTLLTGAVEHSGESHFVPSAPAFRYMGDETAIVNLHFGSPMFVDLTDDSVSPEVIQTGWWEPWIDGVMQKSIGRGDIAVNVGANLGYHVLLMANCVQDSGKIIAYEPNPRLLSRLVRSIKWAGLSAITTIMPFAASNAIGTMKLHFTQQMSGHGGFFKTSDLVWRPKIPSAGLSASDRHDIVKAVAPDAQSINVKVTTLDATIGAQYDYIHFLLIDVEQAEPLVLEGGMDLIRRSPDITIIMEWMNGPTIAPSPKLRKQGIKIIERLAAEGFQFWNIESDRNDIFARPATLDPLTVEQVLAIDQKADFFLRRRAADQNVEWRKI